MYLAPFGREPVGEGYQLALPGFGYGSIPHESIPVLKWKPWICE